MYIFSWCKDSLPFRFQTINGNRTLFPLTNPVCVCDFYLNLIFCRFTVIIKKKWRKIARGKEKLSLAEFKSLPMMHLSQLDSAGGSFEWWNIISLHKSEKKKLHCRYWLHITLFLYTFILIKLKIMGFKQNIFKKKKTVINSQVILTRPDEFALEL